MGKLQKRGVSKYDEVVAALGDMKVSPAFETPKYHVKVGMVAGHLIQDHTLTIRLQ